MIATLFYRRGWGRRVLSGFGGVVAVRRWASAGVSLGSPFESSLWFVRLDWRLLREQSHAHTHKST
jgi:hypothetical protein